MKIGMLSERLHRAGFIALASDRCPKIDMTGFVSMDTLRPVMGKTTALAGAVAAAPLHLLSMQSRTSIFHREGSRIGHTGVSARSYQRLDAPRQHDLAVGLAAFMFTTLYSTQVSISPCVPLMLGS